MKCMVNTLSIEQKQLRIAENFGKIIAVGTTSYRTLESLYWLGVKLIQNPGEQTSQILSLGQWEHMKLTRQYTVKESLEAFLSLLREAKINTSSWCNKYYDYSGI